MTFNSSLINPKPQQYFDIDPIEDLKVIKIKRHNDETGSITELLRLDNGVVCFDNLFVEIKQINFSEIKPNSIKAFHIHPEQRDIFYVPPSCKIKLVLVDTRKKSPIIQTMILGDYNSYLVIVPPGVAHGFKNISNQMGNIIYFTDFHFTDNPQDPKFQEYRLPFDFFGNLIWKEPTN